jgi:hypothetical protein
MPENETPQQNKLDQGTYEIIQGRLSKLTSDLQNRLVSLNASRVEVFGSIETKLIANNRINTENNCIARDIVTIGDSCIFGYNVHFGLREEIKLADVISIYKYDQDHFVPQSLDLFQDDVFLSDFTNLYKYYRNTIFSKFAVIGNYLHLVFQLSDSPTDIKTFKWLIADGKLQYVDNRSEQEYIFPKQYEFEWQEVTRDMHRYGEHPHVSILDKVFVEAVGGDITIKIEDNTDDGLGIYREKVSHLDQTLDDGQYRYADLGNLILIEIKPFQEESRYFVYNHKIQEVKKIDSIGEAVVLLPNDQGIVFPNGYYLQSGGYKQFEHGITNQKFLQRLSSPNGEDFFYIFYQEDIGINTMMSYNIIEQEVMTPIICNGYTFLEGGELCYFKTEDEQTKHHVIQIWQTPFIQSGEIPSENKDSLIYKIGNNDIVKAMAECQALITLLQKEDNYTGLYADIAKQSLDVLDSYYWIREKDTSELHIPLQEINNASNSAIDEFEKVKQLRKLAASKNKELAAQADEVFGKIKSQSFKSIDDFVQVLSSLRKLQGEAITMRDVRYINTDSIDKLELTIKENSETVSQRCVTFLLDDAALQPYHERIANKEKELEAITKVIVGKNLEEEVNQITSDLEMLIDIVSNLEIEDTSQSTKIVDNISLIFSTINQLKANIKNKIKSLGSKEASADFTAQIKLVDQSIINYLDIAKTPEMVEEYLNKVVVQLEELEGKFAEYDEYIPLITDKREEVYNAFEGRKMAVLEARNKRATALEGSAHRILKGIEKKSQSLKTSSEINGYFAADMMVAKLQKVIEQLTELGDIGKAEVLATSLKSAKEDAHRIRRDKNDLYEEGGENVIRLGKYKFGVNKQPLDLAIVAKDGTLFAHLTSTDFFEEIQNDTLLKSQKYWDQSLVSENREIYRGAFLAFKIIQDLGAEHLKSLKDKEITEQVQQYSTKNYSEGYVKGVHDSDCKAILIAFLAKHGELGLLRYSPATRAYAQLYWNTLPAEKQSELKSEIHAIQCVLDLFPKSENHLHSIAEWQEELLSFWQENMHGLVLDQAAANEIIRYLFDVMRSGKDFVVSHTANTLWTDFTKYLKKQKGITKLSESLENTSINERWKIATQWIAAYTQAYEIQTAYLPEVTALILFDKPKNAEIVKLDDVLSIPNLLGDHGSIQNGNWTASYHDVVKDYAKYLSVEVPAYEAYKVARKQVAEEIKAEMRLEEFEPKVLTSFVRNKLIDQVYLPNFGANLAKQLGNVGDNKKTDRMGMLLLVSPPGYGKTTLMEYIANRLGLVFMKINGPAIGHEVTSVDPMAAKNAAARSELEKLNLALEMGNNVMLYLDDIQHCNPEFLQKFISLADGTRQIEGVYKGQSKTYNLRSKKFCVIMAGNPYTESGEKFRIPDMLANRADIYNLGDVVGSNEDLFQLSLVENALTSNPVLQDLSSKSPEDIYTFIKMVQNGNEDGGELKGNYGKQEVNDYLSVIGKILAVRDRVMQVNSLYIKSAAMEDMNRLEPAFKLQGSYRDMNKLVSKVVPIMNDSELEELLFSHYKSEAQTLTSASEANLLKYQEVAGILSEDLEKRWKDIKTTFIKNNKFAVANDKDGMSKVIAQITQFNEHVEGIKDALNRDQDTQL